MYDAIIIGGGASGLCAAIRAHARGKKILIFEANERVGKKLLLAGNGKCNLGNVSLSSDCYNTDFTAKFLPFSEKVTDFFEEIGLKTRVIDGRLYPYSESGKAVLNLLREALPKDIVRTEKAVDEIEKQGDFYLVNGEKARKIVICTGSAATVGRASYHLAENFGHRVTPLKAALVPLKTDTTFIKELNGIRAKVKLTLKINGEMKFCEEGEVLFKGDGVSGIVSMEASRFIEDGKNNDVIIDFVPEMTENDLKIFLKNHSPEGLVQRVIFTAAERQAKAFKQPMFFILKNFKLCNASVCPIKQAQVVRGGLVTSEFNDNLESIHSSGLYACGEVLNVDGKCGGYNLHWAFLTGLIVGEKI